MTLKLTPEARKLAKEILARSADYEKQAQAEFEGYCRRAAEETMARIDQHTQHVERAFVAVGDVAGKLPASGGGLVSRLIKEQRERMTRELYASFDWPHHSDPAPRPEHYKAPRK